MVFSYICGVGFDILVRLVGTDRPCVSALLDFLSWSCNRHILSEINPWSSLNCKNNLNVGPDLLLFLSRHESSWVQS